MRKGILSHRVGDYDMIKETCPACNGVLRPFDVDTCVDDGRKLQEAYYLEWRCDNCDYTEIVDLADWDINLC